MSNRYAVLETEHGTIYILDQERMRIEKSGFATRDGAEGYVRDILIPRSIHQSWCGVLHGISQCYCLPNSAGVRIDFRNRPRHGSHTNKACWIVLRGDQEVDEVDTQEEARDIVDQLSASDVCHDPMDDADAHADILAIERDARGDIGLWD